MSSASDKRDSFFQLNLELTRNAKAAFGRVPVEHLEGSLGAYLGTLKQPFEPTVPGEEPETTEISVENLRQILLLASVTLSRLVADHYKQQH